MAKYLNLFIFIFFIVSASAQINNDNPTLDNRVENNYRDIDGIIDTTSVNNKEFKVELSGKTYFKDYKIINYKNDTTYIDTTLTIEDDYRYNYIHKDNLELIAFANQGQTFNNLAYQFNDNSLFPKIGVRAKHFNFYEVEDVKYYSVPTPTTQLSYRKGMQQGQVLDAFFTFNKTKQFNASIAFKGLKSLGFYTHASSDHGNARLSINYFTKNERYFIKSHFTAQDLANNQNGGLTEESIVNFESGDPEFKDRARLTTNFTNARNVLRGNRTFIDHYYNIWTKNDSLQKIPSTLKVGHIFNYERKNYEYTQDAPSSIFGDSFTYKINNQLKYTKFFNEAYLAFTSPITLGEVRFKINNFNYNYRYGSILISDSGIIEPHLKGNTIAIGGEWHTKFKKISFNADASTIITGDLTGHNIYAQASYVKDSLLSFSASAFKTSKSPNYNFLLNQSSYKAYNWQNNFKNENTNSIQVEIDAKKWIYASVQVTNINNYTYFDAPIPGEQTKPIQASRSVNYLKLKLSKEFRLGHFALDNQFIYQNVSKGEEIFHVPDYITRNTLYYHNYLFKRKPLYLQTGVTFSYFSKYYMNSYNPILSEFHLQNNQEIGGFPMIDFFINFRVRTMRIYLKFEHFNASFTGYDYYSAPSYPYRDFTFRLGLVWNFFI